MSSDNRSSSTPLKVQISIHEATDYYRRALGVALYTHQQVASIIDHLVDAELRLYLLARIAPASSIIEQLKDSGLKADIDIELPRSRPVYTHVDGHNAVG